MNWTVHQWIRISVFNLIIVSLIGFTLRYKILFPLPFVDQKHLLHGHSHFAFGGWVSQVIMTLLVHALSRQTGRNEFKRYNFFLIAHLLTAYGMLIAFPIQGYKPASIIFSTLSIFVSYAFAYNYWKDINIYFQKNLYAHWIKAALLFNILSSAGAFSLAYMMANKIANQNLYLAAVYFFLHFQYNGWFFFAGMGLFQLWLGKQLPAIPALKNIFRLFAFACVPAYFLSALWLPIPMYIYILVMSAAIAQVVGWFWLLNILRKNSKLFAELIPAPGRYLWQLAALAATIKILLQAGSTIPALSDLAFGFRPIVIGYLHLVLLGVVTLYFLGYIFLQQLFKLSAKSKTGCVVFTGGVIMNEIVLMVQGIAAMGYHSIPYINQALLAIALILFTGLCLVFSGLKEKNPAL